jgi:hypothetical protein
VVVSVRWIVRLAGLLLLLVFLILLANLQKRLVEMQRDQRPAPAKTR